MLGYDDLLLPARGGPGRRPRAASCAAGCDERYSLVVVDEFQDTDAVQWHILRDAFVRPGRGRLVLVGDPKQAIYAFRGADVHAYLAARRHGRRRTASRR